MRDIESVNAVEVTVDGRTLDAPLLIYQARVLPGVNSLRFMLLGPNTRYSDHSDWKSERNQSSEEPFPPGLADALREAQRASAMERDG